MLITFTYISIIIAVFIFLYILIKRCINHDYKGNLYIFIILQIIDLILMIIFSLIGIEVFLK